MRNKSYSAKLQNLWRNVLFLVHLFENVSFLCLNFSCLNQCSQVYLHQAKSWKTAHENCSKETNFNGTKMFVKTTMISSIRQKREWLTGLTEHEIWRIVQDFTLRLDFNGYFDEAIQLFWIPCAISDFNNRYMRKFVDNIKAQESSKHFADTRNQSIWIMNIKYVFFDKKGHCSLPRLGHRNTFVKSLFWLIDSSELKKCGPF